jgi:hypothetical protein
MKLTPYRVIVCATREMKRGRKTERVGVAWVAWNPTLTDHSAHAGRLDGSGSFLWLGLRDAKNAVAAAFLDPTVHQVQIRTNQDRKIAVFNRGYKASYWEEEEAAPFIPRQPRRPYRSIVSRYAA